MAPPVLSSRIKAIAAIVWLRKTLFLILMKWWVSAMAVRMLMPDMFRSVGLTFSLELKLSTNRPFHALDELPPDVLRE